ncbi:hypothetical protein GCM10009575_090290 [Streptomyces rhizosphaericus]|uniref:Uncharacterized protein n=1 Tax=Streptomyces rhizosphaericus TaxID=114699 RepID=A0ABP4C1C7_9ACTN
MTDDGRIDRATGRGADWGGKDAETGRRCGCAQEVATIHTSIVRCAPGQPDFGGVHTEPVGDEREHINLAC